LRGAQRRGNPDKNSAAIRKGGKKRKKVWIASRHASLAVAMTRAGTAFFNSLLEHFQAKWIPVRVKKMRKNIELKRDDLAGELAVFLAVERHRPAMARPACRKALREISQNDPRDGVNGLAEGFIQREP